MQKNRKETEWGTRAGNGLIENLKEKDRSSNLKISESKKGTGKIPFEEMKSMGIWSERIFLEWEVRTQMGRASKMN